MAALVALPQSSSRLRAQVLGADLRRRRAVRSAGTVLERAGLRACAGLRHDRDHGADHAESSLPRGTRHHRQAASGARGKDRPRRRGAGARAHDLERDMERRRTASARKTSGWPQAISLSSRRPASCGSWGARARSSLRRRASTSTPKILKRQSSRQPGVAACAVVPVETADGPEPCAVLAVRGGDEPCRRGH